MDLETGLGFPLQWGRGGGEAKVMDTCTLTLNNPQNKNISPRRGANARKSKTICQHNNNLFPSIFLVLLFAASRHTFAEHLRWVPIESGGVQSSNPPVKSTFLTRIFGYLLISHITRPLIKSLLVLKPVTLMSDSTQRKQEG